MLSYAIPARDFDIDEPPIRPLTITNGRRVVAPIERSVGGMFDQTKFKASVRDELVSMIRDFNKREGQ